MPPVYKFVEVSPVTDESLGQAVNEWVAQGWTFEGIRFITTEASRRPGMAFVTFVRDEAPSQSPSQSPGKSKRR